MVVGEPDHLDTLKKIMNNLICTKHDESFEYSRNAIQHIFANRLTRH